MIPSKNTKVDLGLSSKYFLTIVINHIDNLYLSCEVFVTIYYKV